ncbi:MAG: J domain-containing protein [Bacteroidetes bacterium]|nr:J domain-containing protein [Bacteroidota bacterium]
MTNYYDILGIKPSATAIEIKTAFRSLAKLFHPDKNPDGQEEFKKILRAYETLSNPSRKSSYDLRLKFHYESLKNNQQHKTKNWTFEEKELKRRQYYNEHIKKYEKVRNARAEHANLKSNYNEYKYILFATPLAVALFLFVIHFATPSHNGGATDNISKVAVYTELKNGETPYDEYFGSQQFLRGSDKNLSIKNNSGEDVIVCLFTQNSFLRSCVVKDGYFAEIPQLPSKPIDIRYESGKKWNTENYIKAVNIKGAFEKDLHFYKSNLPVVLGPINEITLTPGTNEGFVNITPVEFFKKDNI